MKPISGKSSASVNKIDIYQDAEDLARGAAHFLSNQMHQALAARGQVKLMLSGGSTPREVYARLASPEIAGEVDWSRVHVLWSDERCVPPDHADSNFRMAQESLLQKVPIPERQIHRVFGELPPQEAAAKYELALSAMTDAPVMDLLLLGMGDDGHIASLFPDSPTLAEDKRWVVAVPHDEPPPPFGWRVTVTFPLIFAARQVVLIISGQKKAARLHQALFEQPGEFPLPVQKLRDYEGQLIWLVDQAAASLV